MSSFAKKRKAKVRGEGRRHAAIIADVVHILDCGRLSKFEFEAACRNGLRSGFCLEGRTWTFADAYAAAIVAEALHRIGATRPSWQEGQPEGNAVERHHCARCARPIPEDREGRRFCSKLCATVAWTLRTHRDRVDQHLARQIAAGGPAMRFVAAAIAKPCMHCGRPFLSRDTIRKFCSRECADTANRKHGEAACAHCGKPFRQRTVGHSGRVTRFCSRGCFDATRAEPPAVRPLWGAVSARSEGGRQVH